MKTYYLPKNRNRRVIEMKVFDENKDPVFRVSGATGHKNDVLYVYDLNNQEVARIRQITTGILPRFQLLHEDNYVASFGFNLGNLKDLIYISHLNWLITGEIAAGRYRIRYRRKRLLTVFPVELADGPFNQLDVALENQASVHVAIAALLDSWSMIKKNNPFAILKPRPNPRFKFAWHNSVIQQFNKQK